MSTFQWGLLLMGAAVVLGVWVYNRWTARRFTPKRSSGEPGLAEVPSEALRGDPERQEPTLDGGPPPGDAPTADGLNALGLPGAARAPALLPALDVLVPLALEQVVSGDALLAALPGSRRVGSKPFAVEGLHSASGGWEPPRPGQRYTALQAGVQLANRAGALNDIEFSEFVVKVQAFADALGASPDFPDMVQAVGRARELDQFAGDHDAQLMFAVRARRAAWSPGYLVQHAAALGFVPGALPGRMVLPASAPGAAAVLVLQYETQAALADDPEQTALRECFLTLDVPHVARDERPYVRMREAAQSLARSMEGVVTDAAGQPLNDEQLDRIGADLEGLYDALEARELPAGSALARRLFS
ncbi:cell division protein ZipA C-terminal FtsZ-binding domain-containing protein [Aquabacterium sp. A08]|uniref:cell division protein ZipA C-terminal FtsZ-binding domain-containing protein n=1 Tax=Aquabacterium sp. A08 TaxID=2718532 RepID=UPI001421E941|nr:cell division protein ZipA C-terminal FtsZ-binding domain-containing protein [Aquabacterium sp. A08]NIC42766.1 cell division protein FtsZ [Aquabacterium sp. A08]